MVNKMNIHKILNTPTRYIRSINLERDFNDLEVTSSYIPTNQTCGHLARILEGTSRTSGMRSWRITGDYGSGKSSFALAIAHVLSGTKTQFAKRHKHWDSLVNSSSLPKLFPVLITGSREKPVRIILQKLAQALDNSCPTRKPEVLHELKKELKSKKDISNSAALDFIDRASQYVKRSKKADGMLLIIDEMGKFLEYAALNPSEEDLYFFQELGERASRSHDTPLFVINLLHQGFSAYAENLSIPLQREWNKVSGRFEEIVFHNNIEQALELLSAALGIDQSKLPRKLKKNAKINISEAIQIGWLGRAATYEKTELGERIYPLHPLSIPPLLALFNKYGQNERSLYSFLFSNEKHGLQSFADNEVEEDNLLRIYDVYDYAYSSLSHVINQNGYRSKWRFISAAVDSLASNNETEIKILKTIGLLNLLDSNDLVATEEVIIKSLCGKEISSKEIKEAVARLSQRHAIYHRGISKGLCLWPHTSLNLDTAYQKAIDDYAISSAIAPTLINYVSTRPLVARRHFIETGTLRHFTVKYITYEKVKSYRPELRHSDGEIIIPLCENSEEYDAIIEQIKKGSILNSPGILVALPKPLHGFRNLLLEVGRWEWVSNNTPELNNDSFAAEEVSRQIALSKRLLENRIEDTLTLKNSTPDSGIKWFYKGVPETLETGRALLTRLSEICDEHYSFAPIIRNELVNRRKISTAAALARNKLISSILLHENKKYLGLPENKKPPEMCIYLSMLYASGLHNNSQRQGFSLPDDDTNRMNPLFAKMSAILKQKQGSRHTVQNIWEELSKHPYGVREGVLPILLAVFLKIHGHTLAIYENGTFLPQIDGLDFQRIIKRPSNFEIQYLAIDGVKATVFTEIAAILNLNVADNKNAALLDVVTPLCSFAANLTPYTVKTKSVSAKAQKVKSALRSATDPAKLIFHELPIACGTTSFLDNQEPESTALSLYTETLKSAINELQTSYPSLLDYIRKTMEEAINVNKSEVAFREHIEKRAGNLLLVVADAKMKGFCQTLADNNLNDQRWLESIGSYVCSKPPSKWVDRDSDFFYKKIYTYFEQFIRIEAANFDTQKKPEETSGMRLLITRHDGAEGSYVLHLSPEEEMLADQLSEKMRQLLGTDERIALAATSRFAWKLIENKDN